MEESDQQCMQIIKRRYALLMISSENADLLDTLLVIVIKISVLLRIAAEIRD